MSEQGTEMEIIHLLRRVTVEFGLRQAEFAARHGMHPTDVRALVCLLDAERGGTGFTAGRLGAELGLNSAGTTSLIDRLERLGHLTRTRDPEDGRRVLLGVTPQAVELGWAAFGPMIGSAVALLREFDPGEVAAVRRFLHGFHAAVSEPGRE
ncbi:MarR family winged helix-turn-helix transcriptional regulator [Streptomyces sp. NBC_01257]|uniref:MarR family winged helix-turn-helix transcriptional regulator n=1 Tax=Streptomyces sp. NBC_01257 TaxID=2903799 RepID=UPI002DD88191|nr:MarR family transcriptional regulator [Streptomyces sp. NBC_01257]WRZ64460.1 MarR family transcriptional regulator [Streptomyces sp. NBC_01257]